MNAQIRKVYYVNLYIQDRAYGGPEEGGWWFDVGEFIRSHTFKFTSYEAARARYQLLNERTNRTANDGRNTDINSVMCEGEYRWVIENEPGQSYPQSRPFYE